MDGFLACYPTVFVVENRYEILVFAKENGIIAIKVGNEIFFEENNGALSSEKRFAKISVPQTVLDACKNYTVLYRKTVDRKIYYPIFESELCESFDFCPLEKTEDIKVYHIADVHRAFGSAERAAGFFGNDTDLFVVNGDISEFRSESDYLDAAGFTGRISKGKIPVVLARGNHDARGKQADRFTDYFPGNGKKSYYEFDAGVLHGLVLDCGEDKRDAHKEYNGVNAFEAFRKSETEFLTHLQPTEGKINFAICHICPIFPTENAGDCFDIERETYKCWNANLKRINVRFMLSGHLHKQFVMPKHDARCFDDNEYLIVTGSAIDYETEYCVGAALNISKERLRVRFTDSEKKVLSDEEYSL